MERLRKLVGHLETIDGYRFYCSSLLVLYDGDVNKTPQVDVRMIDFAKSIVKNDIENHHMGPDSGYILGVTSLINIFTSLDEKLNLDT